MKKITVTHKLFEVDVDYVPCRPAPPCSDHDSPAFSDPGDDEEFEIVAVRTPSGEDITDLLDTLGALDAVYEIAHKLYFDRRVA